MNAETLIALWSERDNRYGMRKIMGRVALLSAEEESSIIAFRRYEVRALIEDDPQRIRALTILANWRPPLAR